LELSSSNFSYTNANYPPFIIIIIIIISVWLSAGACSKWVTSKLL
jgi:hypothetical protein